MSYKVKDWVSCRGNITGVAGVIVDFIAVIRGRKLNSGYYPCYVPKTNQSRLLNLKEGTTSYKMAGDELKLAKIFYD